MGPRRMTRSATAAASSETHNQIEGTSSEQNEKQKEDTKSFTIWAGGLKGIQARPSAGRRGPNLEQQINWLKSYEEQLQEDADETENLIKKMDQLIQIAERKKVAADKKVAVAKALAAATARKRNDDNPSNNSRPDVHIGCIVELPDSDEEMSPQENIE